MEIMIPQPEDALTWRMIKPDKDRGDFKNYDDYLDHCNRMRYGL